MHCVMLLPAALTIVLVNVAALNARVSSTTTAMDSPGEVAKTQLPYCETLPEVVDAPESDRPGTENSEGVKFRLVGFCMVQSKGAPSSPGRDGALCAALQP